VRILRVGIAGYGVVGRRRHNFINQIDGIKVVAVCDRTFGSQVTAIDGVRNYADYSQLLSEDLDILFVCLTNDIAPDVTMAGLQKGLHVFCEKPPGKSVRDIRRVIEIEKMYPHLKLMYGFNHRYHDSVQDALAIVKSHSLGNIINMQAVYGKSKLVTFDQPDWRTKRAIAGGGVLLDQGIHMVDLMRLFAGEFTEVHSFISNAHWKYDVEDNAYVLMRTSDGIVGMLNSSATQWRHRFHLDINLERGSLILSGLLSGSKSYGAETLTVVTADPGRDSGDPREQKTLYNHDPSWKREIKTFVDSIRADSVIERGSSMDALNTMKLVYKIYYSDSDWRNTYKIECPDE